MAVDRIINQGDTWPPLAMQILDNPLWGKRVGEPHDIRSLTRIVATFRHEETNQIVHTGVATVIDTAAAMITVDLDSAVSERPGLISIELLGEIDADRKYRLPATGRRPFYHLEVRSHLVPDVVNLVTQSPNAGALFIPDNTTDTVVYHDQMVLAGSSSTVTVPAGVQQFTIAINPQGTPWTLATVPTISPNFGVVDPSVPAALAASAGDEVYLYTNGTTWYATTPTIGAATVAGTDTDSFVHSQAIPLAAWTINHNLGYFPAGVHIEDPTGQDMTGQITHVSVNQTVITFAVAVAGTATVG